MSYIYFSKYFLTVLRADCNASAVFDKLLPHFYRLDSSLIFSIKIFKIIFQDKWPDFFRYSFPFCFINQGGFNSPTLWVVK
ncbi:MAG: hypothetical protein A2017_07645 [Lentisphaerae bacterium GWF2_44_16]|nr:MAG: hypothetical protein A2017_07645 [Lentisphaerae bacterium GWF2_44_16]